MGQKMEFPKWHDRPNDSKEPINKQNVLDGKNFLKLANTYSTSAGVKSATCCSTIGSIDLTRTASFVFA